MNDTLRLAAAALTGAILGLVFFGGLWVTVRNLNDMRHPAVWMLVSLVLRFACVLIGFFLLARFGGWQHVLAAMCGFVLLRVAVLRSKRIGNSGEVSRS
jgi:F1F0 ATPase subunit 2